MLTCDVPPSCSQIRSQSRNMCSEVLSLLSPRSLRIKTESRVQISQYFNLNVNLTLAVRSICTPPRVQQSYKSDKSWKYPLQNEKFPPDKLQCPAEKRDESDDLEPIRRGRLPSVDTPLRKPWLSDGVPQFVAADFVVGQGGFGMVVKALYKGEEVAVKVISKHRRASLRSLDNEQNAIELEHPNLVKISRVVNDETHMFGLVLMENCPSMTLQRVIDDPAFEICPETRLRYLVDICKALSYCHEQGIIHLDVKPQNVLVLLNTNRSKLCDFGMSKRIDSNLDSGCEYFGTVAYSAPELFCRKTPTAKSDVYSYGILMWQLQTRETPYLGLARDAVIFKVVSQNLRPLPVKINLFENDYANIYQTCWRSQSSDRPTISKVASQLGKIFRRVENQTEEKNNGFQ